MDAEETREKRWCKCVRGLLCSDAREQWRPGPVRVPHVHEVYYTHTVSRPSAFRLSRLFGMTKGADEVSRRCQKADDTPIPCDIVHTYYAG